MRVLLICFITAVFSTTAIAEQVKLESYKDQASIDRDLTILKLQTKVHDLQLEISDLKDRFEQIEHLQKRVLNLIGETAEDTETILEQKTKESEYNYAYTNLINNELDRAERAYDLYLEKYPNDARTGEIYFWKGEISYKRKEYTDALEYYLTSYQKYPDNSRNLDALFKMSIVLGFLGKAKEACEGFSLLVNNQTNISESLRKKALTEAVQAGCIE